ncbi:LOW QUALITY PROTEIN: UBN2_3 domain-containing protein, partial [Cephalotus follicularis]
PMHMHPFDTPGANLVAEQLTGNDNYGVWSRAMVIALKAKNKIGFIDGTCAKPNEDLPLFHQWERCNAIVLSWIMNTVSKELFIGIVYSTDAQFMWKDMKERFDKVNGLRIFSVHQDIGSLTQGKADSRCEYCGWTGHKKENCYKLIGYPPGHRLYKGNQK